MTKDSLGFNDFIIRTLRGMGGGVGGRNAHNKDLIRPIQGSIVPKNRFRDDRHGLWLRKCIFLETLGFLRWRPTRMKDAVI